MTDNVQSPIVVFEQPLNERMRAFLRIEQLFKHIDELMQQHSELACRLIIERIIAVFETFERFDIKGETIKELERLTEVLVKWQAVQGINESLLTNLIDKSKTLQDALHNSPRIIGETVLNDELFAGIRKRTAIAGGACHFDFPMYHYWLNTPIGERRDLLLSWLNELSAVDGAVRLVLSLIRESASPEMVTAENGYYERSLKTSSALQCIRLFLATEQALFPEISAGRHQLHVRFFERRADQKCHLYQQNLEFHLVCCQM